MRCGACERSLAFEFSAEDRPGIAIREGDLASLPVLKRTGVSAAIRVSCCAYTTNKEIDQLVATLNQAIGAL
jgi:selenocysteine lyase/cysteine desulfurase